MNLELIVVLDNKRFRWGHCPQLRHGASAGLGVIGHGQNPPTPLKMRFKRVLWLTLPSYTKRAETSLKRI